jgi:hypothetical protein
MKAGDHIRILREGRWLHAIDVGDRTAIHFGPGGLRRSLVDDLARGAEKIEVVTHPQRVYAPKAVVARAFSRFAEAAFGAMFADSEAFAVWCKMGNIPVRHVNGVAGGPRAPVAVDSAQPPTLPNTIAEQGPVPRVVANSVAVESPPRARPPRAARPRPKPKATPMVKAAAKAKAAPKPKTKVKAVAKATAPKPKAKPGARGRAVAKGAVPRAAERRKAAAGAAKAAKAKRAAPARKAKAAPSKRARPAARRGR